MCIKYITVMLTVVIYEELLREISPPRIAEIMQVHKREVEVTQGLQEFHN